MRTPTLFFRLVCGAALATLSLSTLPAAAQTRHHPPVDMDEFLMPDVAPAAGGRDADRAARDGDEANDPGRRDMEKYWRLMHGDRTGKINSSHLLRALRQAAHMRPLTWAALHSGGTNGPGDGQYGFGHGSGGGGGTGGGVGGNLGGGGGGGPRRNSATAPSAQHDAIGFIGPGLPAPDPSDGWKFVGPNQILTNGNNVFTGPDPCSGRVNAAAFDPNNPNIYYVAAPGGGIWKTTNAGANWVPLTDYVAGLTGAAFSSIAVDPKNSNVLYAGTGDYDGNDENGSGLLKSVDGGVTWQFTSLPSGNFVIHKILIDPNNSSHVIVSLGINGSGTGAIFQSTDAGATWQDVADFPSAPGPNGLPAGSVNNIVYNSDTSMLYAAVDGAGIFGSSDNGNTWSGPLGGLGATDRVDVAASPLQPNTLYFLSNGDQAIYKSIDGGNTWNDITNNFGDSYGLTDPTQPWGQGFYDFYINISSATFTVGGIDVENGPGQVSQDVVYVGLFSVSSCFSDPNSTAGGFWSDITYSYTSNATIHTDQHCLAVNPQNPNQMLLGNDGGIYLANYSPDDNTFDVHGLNNNLGITQCYDTAVNPVNLNDVLIGAQDNAFPHASGDLNIWNLIQTGDGMGVRYAPTAPLVEYITEYNGKFARETDNDWNGDPFNASEFDITIPDTIEFFTPLTMSANSHILYSGGLTFDTYDHGASVYPAKGGKWTNGAVLSTDPNVDICVSVGASPSNENYAYAGMASGIVFFSQNKGKTAARIDGNNPKFPQSAFPLTPLPASSFVGGYKNVRRLYVALSQNTNSNLSHIFRSDDITVPNPQWWDLSGTGGPSPLPEVSINAMVVLPHDDERSIIVATDIGLFMTTNADAAPAAPVIWSPLNTIPSTNTTLPIAVVNKLNYNASTGTLDAATYGRGLWRAKIGSDTPLLIRANMPYYKGSRTQMPARVELFQAHLPDVAPNFEEPGAVGYPYKVTMGGGAGTPNPFQYYLQPTEIHTGSLSPAGLFATNVSARGYFDVLITVPRFLRKRIKTVNTVLSPLNTVNLIIGDCAGPTDPTTGYPGPPDNVIDGNDLAAINNYLIAEQLGSVSQFNNGPLDVNGDGVVDIKDLNLVRLSMFLYGDPVRGD
jgi:photosystem II stability/assembly factor-like uncharacterized protein